MSLKNFPVRAGFVAVLALFGALIVIIGALSIVSLQRNNAASAKISVQDTEVIGLKDVYINNLRARSALARAYIALLSGAGADSKEEQGALAAASGYYDLAKQNYASFAAVPKWSDASRAAADRVGDTFKAHAAALDALFDALHAGDGKRYAAVNEREMTDTSAAFGHAAEDFFKLVQADSAEIRAAKADSYQMMVYLVSGTLIVAAALIVLVYQLLNRAVVQPLTDAVDELSRVARGDLTGRIAHESRNEIGRLFDALRAMQTSLTDIVTAVRQGAHSIEAGVHELASGHTDLSSRTEEQAASLQTTASSMEQLTSAVRHNTDNAQQASRLAIGASDTATRGGEAVSQVTETMHKIAGSSNKIVDIIAVIEGIAFQTNILALNAAVEAARAGENGRGFAVVASEVRSLAQRSATAAKEIKALIHGAAQDVSNGNVEVERAATTMADVVRSVKQVTDIISEIAAASQEQSAGIGQVGQSVSQMDLVTQQNAALVEQAAAATASLEGQTQRLSQAVSVFRVRG
ncbi:methyl-accepting chemotaxis protein [Paraburkholderia rhizosphaerae]|uniref:Methyl-accepting chemotaxis sensory transducer with TarH sensor n=1 Tax=Paraburkholderia rhizosphaerae TaxID=480658 RepID=A0A4R8LJ20_9BURK|nr:methyl-accepting chemotaxis protein [Paraburkholderia rhizosphaerae]TDY42433.1 methyl-accepting chemotaxis sensory transducer with TarH sensor [Paraburkholderia rhizosphaerae]